MQIIAPLIDPAKLDTLNGKRAANRRLRLLSYHLETARRAGDDFAVIVGDAQAVLGMAGTPRKGAVKVALGRNLDILATLRCLDAAGMSHHRARGGTLPQQICFILPQVCPLKQGMTKSKMLNS